MERITLQKLLDTIKKVNPDADVGLIELAYHFAAEAHTGQLRKSGEPYIDHPLHTALTLAEWGLDDATIAAGLLHDVPEDTPKTLKDVEKEFGKEVRFLVEGITKLGLLKYRGMERYIENLRRMFVAMARDIRVILIKFADRLHNMKTLSALPPDKQKRIALETLEIYAPIANRLGMGELKGQLEDAAFPYIFPEEHAWLVAKTKKILEEYARPIQNVIDEVQKILRDTDFHIYTIHGRTKHLYSLHQKLLRNNRELGRIHDLMAVRVVVENVEECYAVLGLIHKRWKPLKGRIKDYIATPKPNGYQSLHTTIWDDKGRIVEIQIRTFKMHEQAEYGIAAHWHYKENEKGKVQKLPSKERTAWIQQVLKIQKEAKNETEYLESLKLDIFGNRIFVFTPSGDVIDLPEDSTPVDFGYHIHSDIGNKCVGAKVNQKIVPLQTKLKSGDVIEIFVDKNRKGPSQDWLAFVKTNSAKHNIRSFTKRDRFRLNTLLRNLVGGKKTK